MAMDEQDEQPNSPLSRPINTYSIPKAKRRKSRSAYSRRDQIQEEYPEPSNEPVSYEKSGKSTRNKQKRGLGDDSYNKTKTKSSAMDRAKELLATLDDSCPKFAKTLVRSNVTVGFWMHLPMWFCKLHMPMHDATINVETENGEYMISYISERTALSGGWKAFCGFHKLREGDVLVFLLVKPLSFKVYIVRGTLPEKENGENADPTENEINSDQGEEDAEIQEKTKTLDPFSQKDGKNASDIVKSSESEVNFEESFGIIVNGLAIDSELSENHRNKYFQLCRSQNTFLHNNLLNSINHKLAAEIIIGTVDISEAIRGSSLASWRTGFPIWDKTLKGFELLGMNVGFLRSRLDRLMNLAAESEEAVESEGRHFREEQARIDKEAADLEVKVKKLKEARKRLCEEIEGLKVVAESQERIFRDAVDAPW